jgi:hypothetical protein
MNKLKLFQSFVESIIPEKKLSSAILEGFQAITGMCEATALPDNVKQAQAVMFRENLVPSEKNDLNSEINASVGEPYILMYKYTASAKLGDSSVYAPETTEAINTLYNQFRGNVYELYQKAHYQDAYNRPTDPYQGISVVYRLLKDGIEDNDDRIACAGFGAPDSQRMEKLMTALDDSEKRLKSALEHEYNSMETTTPVSKSNLGTSGSSSKSKPLGPNVTYKVSTPNGGKVQIFNSSGKVVTTVNAERGVTTIKTPSQPGTYFAVAR